MPPAWPLLPAATARFCAGLVAEAEPGPVGLVAVDMAGSGPLILFSPAYQRRGIGTGRRSRRARAPRTRHHRAGSTSRARPCRARSAENLHLGKRGLNETVVPEGYGPASITSFSVERQEMNENQDTA